jgi:hypothetical protein
VPISLLQVHMTEQWLATKKLGEVSAEEMQQLKSRGFSDAQIGRLTGGGRGLALELASWWESWSCRAG